MDGSGWATGCTLPEQGALSGDEVLYEALTSMLYHGDSWNDVHGHPIISAVAIGNGATSSVKGISYSENICLVQRIYRRRSRRGVNSNKNINVSLGH